MSQSKTYGTQDLGLAAYLLILGYEIIGLDGHGFKTVFHFSPNDKLSPQILRYYNKKASTDPLTFYETVRNLRKLALDGGEGQRERPNEREVWRGSRPGREDRNG